MDFNYSINDISTKCGVSVQSLYKLINKNKQFITSNSTRRHRKVFYNQKAMDFFVSYYLPEEMPPSSEKITEVQEILQEPPINEKITEEHKSSLEALKAENDALKAEIDTLRKQLNDKEAERKELFYQNSALLLMLQQEKKEKMLLLPPPPQPKKSLGDRVKSIFKKQPKETLTDTVENSNTSPKETLTDTVENSHTSP